MQADFVRYIQVLYNEGLLHGDGTSSHAFEMKILLFRYPPCYPFICCIAAIYK
jgi:hypothetical protein